MRRNIVASLILGIALASAPSVCHAALPAKLSGAITGLVTDPEGVPQMGATVLLFNRQDRLTERTLTDERGEFRFLSLFPDTYSVRVTLASYVSAFQKNILVQPGMRSVLAVNLNTLFSKVRLSYPPLQDGSLMTEEWKWVLRGSPSTRPVLRFAEGERARRKAESSRGSVFSETRGVVQVSGGGVPANNVANEADVGTAFALATSLWGNNLLEVAGSLGYGSHTGVPTAAFRTTYSRRRGGNGPEISVTLRQLQLPGQAAWMGVESVAPVLRSVAASYDDRKEIIPGIEMQYGMTLDSITFVDRVNYASPYARLTVATPDGGEVSLAYASGNARPDVADSDAEDGQLQRGLNSLGMFPRISTRNRRARIQRGQEYEVAYTRKAGSRTYQVSAFSEAVRDAALSMVSPEGMYQDGDVLPDLFSGNRILNAGDYRTAGYSMSLTQGLGEHVSATLMYGSLGALTADNRTIAAGTVDELRSMIRTGRKQAVTARIAATLPACGARVEASYQWTDRHWAMPGHLYSMQTLRPLPGLNFYVRQPIPSHGFPVRMELTADLRNLLAQGYLPLQTADGRQVLLVQTPRSVRGGLNFIF